MAPFVFRLDPLLLPWAGRLETVVLITLQTYKLSAATSCPSSVCSLPPSFSHLFRKTAEISHE